MGHACRVIRLPEGSGRWRLALLVGLLLPVTVLTGLWLRPGTGVLGTAALPAVGAVPAAAGTAPRAEPDGETLRLHSGGVDRAVLVQDPLSSLPARGIVMVLGPHALTAARTAQDLRFDELRSRGYAVAYPSTLDGDWNAGRCCGSSQRRGVDDVLFLQDVRGRLMQRYGLPGSAVGLVGYSTGGQMVYRTVCEHPTFARAAVIVAGSLETTCAPRRPLPATLVVHGLEDSTVPWATTVRRTQLLDYAPSPALHSLAEYADAGRCSGRVEDRSDGRHLIGWEECDRIPLLSAAGMPGTGHGWEALRGSVYATRFLPQQLERT
ncbi:MAG: poly(3-hydroxybutyrate) depolymerase [Frankiales bacterium]|jgi:poly(3-hydroxybutyrate) depolymerase|nr:poly(3-hydroxybutyrate) depolymerase [Frankiales bacterium]